MANKVYLRHTKLGAYLFEVFENDELLARGDEKGTRKEALEAMARMKALNPQVFENVVDQTPEKRLGLVKDE